MRDVVHAARFARAVAGGSADAMRRSGCSVRYAEIVSVASDRREVLIVMCLVRVSFTIGLIRKLVQILVLGLHVEGIQEFLIAQKKSPARNSGGVQILPRGLRNFES